MICDMGFHFYNNFVMPYNLFSLKKKEHFEETAYLFKYLEMIKKISVILVNLRVPANFLHLISTFHANFIAVRQ